MYRDIVVSFNQIVGLVVTYNASQMCHYISLNNKLTYMYQTIYYCIAIHVPQRQYIDMSAYSVVAALIPAVYIMRESILQYRYLLYILLLLLN